MDLNKTRDVALVLFLIVIAQSAGEQFIYFDYIWSGEFLPTAAVEAMLEEKLQNSVGGLTVAGILHSMGGDIWSQQHENSRSTLRLALPLAMRMKK